MTPRTRHAWVAAIGLLAGCSWSAGHSTGLDSVDRLPGSATTTTVAPPATSPTTATPPTLSSTEAECEAQDWSTASYRPDGGDGTDDVGSLDRIRRRGRLVVGVDENTLGFASRDTATGLIEGFEVGLAHAIAEALFGDEYRSDSSVELRPVVTDEKTDVVMDGEVDMTIDAISMSCARWEDVAFSAEYYTAHQQFLVRAGSDIVDAADLDGSRVCVTSGSSSARILQRLELGVELVVVPDRTRCLLELQDGNVDAYYGHDSFLYGLKLQDPTVEIIDALPGDESVSHYGIAIDRGRTDLVRFVNGVLAAMRENGRWDELHEGLRADLPGLLVADQPEPAYRDGTA